IGHESGPRPIDGTIIFPPIDPTRTLQPHRDALILSLEIGDFDVRRILVDPGSSADLVQASVVGRMGHSLTGLENPGRVLSGFNGLSTTSLGDIILPVQAGPVTLNVQFSVVQELSPFNVILGRTWLHYMKVIPSTYHQMEPARKVHPSLSLVIHVTNSNYWVRRRKIPRQQIPYKQSKFRRKYSFYKHQFPHDTRRDPEHANRPQRNYDIFAWAHADMKGIHPSITSHRLNVFPTVRLVRQKIRRFHPDRQKVIRNEINKLLEVGFIREVDYSDWLANVVVVPKKEGKWRVCVDYTNLNNACPKDSFPLPLIDQIVDSTAGQGMLSFLDVSSGYHQIPMSPTDEEKNSIHNVTRPLLLQSHAIRTQKTQAPLIRD
ncbi:Transposon Ty3-I Gag-Pol polyprotein, partial [Vitis vinifera]